MQPPGYHLAQIPKGEVGELSKIREEAAEAMDAANQGVHLMVLVELSDLVGAIHEFRCAHGQPVPGDEPWDMGSGSLAGIHAIAGRVANMSSDDAQVPGTLARLEQEIARYVRCRYPCISWEDLKAMAKVTARAFASGRRA